MYLKSAYCAAASSETIAEPRRRVDQLIETSCAHGVFPGLRRAVDLLPGLAEHELAHVPVHQRPDDHEHGGSGGAADGAGITEAGRVQAGRGAQDRRVDQHYHADYGGGGGARVCGVCTLTRGRTQGSSRRSARP